jgi:hypothetical protein
MKDTILKKFFELKAKQLFLKLQIKIYYRPAYLSDQMFEMETYLTAQGRLDKLEEGELKDFVLANQEMLKSCNLQEEANNYKVSIERQKEIAKETIGRETTIEELLEVGKMRY